MKKIIFISPWLWTKGDHVGMPTLYYTIQGFMKKGYEVHLIIGSNVRETSFNYEGIMVHQFKIDKYSNTAEFDVFESIFERKINLVTWQKEKRNWLKNATKSLINLVEKLKPKYVYAVSPLACKVAATAVPNNPQVWRFMGVNIIADVESGKISLSQIKKHPLEYLTFKYLAKLSKRILPAIVITDDGTRGNKMVEKLSFSYSGLFFSKNGIEDFKKAKPIPLEEVFNQQQFRLYEAISGKKSEGMKVIISTNRFAFWKRNDLVVETARVLIREMNRKDVLFVLIGDGPELSNLKEVAKKLGIANQIIFVGSVPRNSMNYWFGVSDIYISMMDLGQLGNSTFEAGFFGLPLVLRNNGDTSSVFKDNHTALLVNNAKHGAQAINYLLTHEDLAVAIGKAARSMLKKTLGTWDSRTEREIQWLEKAL